MKFKYKSKNYTIKKSDRKNKEYVSISPSGFKVYFADPNMNEFPGTKMGNNYCSRSLGIGKKYNSLNNPNSANFWSRLLWSCKGNKSVSKERFFGKLK